LVKFAAGLFIALVVVGVAMRGMFHYFATVQSLGPPASPFENARALPPQPRLQPQPRLDLRQLHRREDEKLNTYGWVNQKDGVVRIPIERAMDLVAERGLPARQAPGLSTQSTRMNPPAKELRP
jgi:hypothetical protein